jgi:hypothetical protein
MPGALTEEVLPSLSGLHLFIHLFRRFGPTSWPWDQTRHLVEYVLTTLLDGVYLTVVPDIQSLYDMRRLMFGYLSKEPGVCMPWCWPWWMSVAFSLTVSKCCICISECLKARKCSEQRERWYDFEA